MIDDIYLARLVKTSSRYSIAETVEGNLIVVVTALIDSIKMNENSLYKISKNGIVGIIESSGQQGRHHK